MATIAVIPLKSIMPGTEHLCWRPCTHIACLNIRAQSRVPCSRCGVIPATGTPIYILARGEFGAVAKQMHARCYEFPGLLGEAHAST